MIAIDGLTYRYPDGTVGLSEVTARIPRGEVFALVGRSGSGKTTLLNCLGRFLRPTSGAIAVDGRPLADFTEVELRQTLGIVFQELHLFPHLTVLENLTLAPTIALGRSRRRAEKEAGVALERFGIADLAGKLPNEISGGQAQRVAIARALVLRPSYLLLDEPTSALDVRTARELGEWLLDLRQETTFVVVTHDTDLVRQVATRGALVSSGGVAAEGEAGELLRALEGAT